MTSNEADSDPLEKLLEERRDLLGEDVWGPVRVVPPERDAAGGGRRFDVATSRLVAVDPDDEALHDVFVPVPVSGEVELDPHGDIRHAAIAEPGEGETREARAFALSLLARGAVRGHKPKRVMRGPGPPTRQTHALEPDERGRRVLRRIGFD